MGDDRVKRYEMPWLSRKRLVPLSILRYQDVKERKANLKIELDDIESRFELAVRRNRSAMLWRTRLGVIVKLQQLGMEDVFTGCLGVFIACLEVCIACLEVVHRNWLVL